jgi:hypothetical protein
MMTMEETKSAFIWTCDRCGVAAEFPALSFWHAVDELKARRWQFIKDNDYGAEGEGDWTHYCGKCRKTSAEIMAMPVVRKPRSAT